MTADVIRSGMIYAEIRAWLMRGRTVARRSSGRPAALARWSPSSQPARELSAEPALAALVERLIDL